MKRLMSWVLLLSAVTSASAMGEVRSVVWGRSEAGQEVKLYTLTSGQVEVRVMSYGAKIVSIRTPDKDGRIEDITLGYDSFAEYLADKRTHFGTVVGRFANRIANGTFVLDGKTYHVPINNGTNALHGGTVGFDQYVWKGHEVPGGVEFKLVSPDGDMGFPGTLTARVKYTLRNSVLRVDYDATTDKATVINLTNHSYFNLSGGERDSILHQRIEINADRYTPVNENMIPTGEQASVASTPFDLRHSTAIGQHIGEANEQLRLTGGYDHNYVLNGPRGRMNLAARVYDPASGRTLVVSTTEPGVQFYSGNKLDGTFTGREGKPYQRNAGFCLETQHFPDSPNEPGFPSTVLRPGDVMHSRTNFTFGTH
jgi:aldose 1-epimerase